MKDWVDKYRRLVSASLLMLSLSSLLIGGALGWLVAIGPDNPLVYAGALVGGVTVAWLVSLITRPGLTQTAEKAAAALDHVSAHPAEQPPPIKDDLTRDFVSRVYQLAANASQLTTNIDDERLMMNAILDLLPVYVLVFDDQDQLKFINSAAASGLKYQPAEVIGWPRSKLVDWLFQTDETFDVWLEQSQANKISEQHFWERVSLILKDGERLIGDVAARYEKNQSGGLETVVIFIDRTNEYVADEAQLDFVAVAAHELRGPITVIRGYLDVFNEELTNVLTVDQRALLQKMTVSAEMLSLYVNNILNVARVSQQALKLHIVKADWREIIKEAYNDLSLRAQARGRVLKLELPDAVSPVAVDHVSILEVINNLVDNAIKYSPEGSDIIIKVAEHDGQIETTVQDFGIGIPEAVVGNLFKKFYRSHRTRQGVSGTGLGLYLSKAILDGHGGNIWVRSKEDEGSTFGFDLPTFDTVADTLKAGNNEAADIKRSNQGWIKNHAMYRR